MLIRSLLRFVGSLWFAALLLVLLLVAMACATVFESTVGTEQALADFYHARWFEALLYLLGLNVLASMVVRFPFHRRQVGFVMTHGGILLTLLGALITQRFGIDGRVGLLEGQSVKEFTVPQATLTVLNQRDQDRWQIDLADSVGGFDAFADINSPVFSRSNLQIALRGYLPDGTLQQEVRNDATAENPAVDVSLADGAHDHRHWIFAGRPVQLAGKKVEYRVVTDRAALAELLSAAPAKDAAAPPTVRLEYEGATQVVPLSDCLNQTVPVGETGFTFEVQRYLPHATVGDGGLTNLSDNPVNPAIEGRLTGPDGSDRVIAFARFPDFRAMHDEQSSDWIKVTFEVPQSGQSGSALEILAGPDGDLHARFNDPPQAATVKLAMGVPIDTPWADQKLTVMRRYDRAQMDWRAVPVTPVREDRQPAILLGLQAQDHDGEMWLLKNQPRRVTINGTPYELAYSDKTLPLGFELKLNRFRVGYYPGGARPRSFESHVTIIDPASGSPQDRVISMNNPTKVAGYNLYQSSYRLGAEQNASFLSVARDPGLPVVFAGYIITMAGMLYVLGLRMAQKRASSHPDHDHTSSPHGDQGDAARRPKRVLTLKVGGPCHS